MQKQISGLVVGAAISAILAAGCSNEPPSEPADGTTGVASITGQPGMVPEPTATPTPMTRATDTATPSLIDVPTPALTPTLVTSPAAPVVPFEEYLSICQESLGDDETLDEDTSNKELSAMVAEMLAKMEEVTPPTEVIEWHNKLLSVFRNIIGILEELPADETVDFGTYLLIAVTVDADMEEAEANLRTDVRTRMEEADCIESSAADQAGPAEPFAEPTQTGDPTDDDHGDDLSSATSITVGEAVEGELRPGTDVDYFRFQAASGQSYVLTILQWSFSSSGSHPVPEHKLVTFFDSGGRRLATSDSLMGLAGVAPSSDYLYVAIGDRITTGSYTIMVALDDHGHDPATATRVAIAEPVQMVLYGSDSDFLAFRPENGQDYRIILDSLSSIWGSPRVVLYDSAGLELAEFDYDAEIILEATNSGEHYIAVTVGPDGFGNFTLEIVP